MGNVKKRSRKICVNGERDREIESERERCSLEDNGSGVEEKERG